MKSKEFKLKKLYIGLKYNLYNVQYCNVYYKMYHDFFTDRIVA